MRQLSNFKTKYQPPMSPVHECSGAGSKTTTRVSGVDSCEYRSTFDPSAVKITQVNICFTGTNSKKSVLGHLVGTHS